MRTIATTSRSAIRSARGHRQRHTARWASVDAINWSTDANLCAGDKCLCFQDSTDGQFYLIHSGQHAEAIAVVSVDGTEPEANCLWLGKVMEASGSPAGGCTNPLAESADCYLLVLNHDGDPRTDKLTLKVGDCYVGRKVFEIEGVPVYANRHGRSLPP